RGHRHEGLERDAVARATMAGLQDRTVLGPNHSHDRIDILIRDKQFSNADPERADDLMKHGERGTNLVVFDFRQETLGTSDFLRKLAQAALPVETRMLEVSPDEKIVVLGWFYPLLWTRSVNDHEVSRFWAAARLDRKTAATSQKT